MNQSLSGKGSRDLWAYRPVLISAACFDSFLAVNDILFAFVVSIHLHFTVAQINSLVTLLNEVKRNHHGPNQRIMLSQQDSRVISVNLRKKDARSGNCICGAPIALKTS